MSIPLLNISLPALILEPLLPLLLPVLVPVVDIPLLRIFACSVGLVVVRRRLGLESAFVELLLCVFSSSCLNAQLPSSFCKLEPLECLNIRVGNGRSA